TYAMSGDLDAVVVTGDVADDGSVEGCRLVRDRVAAFAEPRGIPHVYCTGNHDARPGFREALGSGHAGADGRDIGELLDPESCASVGHVGGLRVITLDSLVPGSTHGFLDARQLEHLARVLASPAPD